MKAALLLFVACCLSLQFARAQQRPEKAGTRPQLEQGSATAEGKRTGKWNFYTRGEQLELTFDYDSSRIKFIRPDTARYYLRTGEQWALQVPTRPPHLLGSTDQRLQALLGALRYPVSALRQQLQGTVLLSYTVDPNGHTSHYSIEKSLSPDCDQEVWRALKPLADNWIPAVYLGHPVAAQFYLAVTFKMMDEAASRYVGRAARRNDSPAVTSPAPVPPAKPPYFQEVVVTALAIERSTRTGYIGR